jgi:hypothetical protein
MTTRWEYGSMLASPFPVRGQFTHCVVAVHEHIWDCDKYPMEPMDMLNILGEEGWEVVAVLSLGIPGDPNDMTFRYVLKRERQVDASTAPSPGDAEDNAEER